MWEPSAVEMWAQYGLPNNDPFIVYFFMFLGNNLGILVSVLLGNPYTTVFSLFKLN